MSNLEGTLNSAQQFLQTNRLFQEIKRANAGRFHRRFYGCVARQHHHRHGQLPCCFPFLEQRYAIGIRHPNVEQDQGRRVFASHLARRGGVLSQANDEAFVFENFLK